MRRAQEHRRWPESAFGTPYNLRDDTYRIYMAEFSQARSREEADGARVRLRTSAAHRSGLAITFRQAPSSNSSCCPQPHQGSCLRWWGLRMFLVAPATRCRERLTLVGEREPFLSREERAAMQCALDLLSLVSADDSFEHCPP